MRRLSALFVILAVSVATPSYATFYNGNDLKQMCDRSKTNCTSYVLGAADMIILNVSQSKQFICIPDRVDSIQLTDIVIKHLETNPETRDFPAVALIWNALQKAFPCQNAVKP